MLKIGQSLQFIRLALGFFLVCGLLFVGISPASAAGLCYVKADATPPGTGITWDTAYPDLQSALGNLECTEIWVAAGTYKPTGGTDRAVSFVLKNGVGVYGGFAGTETLLNERNLAVNVTSLSGDIGIAGDPADNSYHVLKGNGTDNTALLDGFTITGGNANGTAPNNAGGGMYNDAGSPSLANLIFSGNLASIGAGMYNKNSSPSLTHVSLNSNTATSNGGGIYSTSSSNPNLVGVTFSQNHGGLNGGGIFNSTSSPTLTNVTFDQNSANSGGGMYIIGASSPILTNVTFSANQGVSSGGGMFNSNSTPSLVNVIFISNSAGSGGGMYNSSGPSSPSLLDVVFEANSANYGGGIYNSSSNPTLTNVTFSANSAANNGGGIYGVVSNPSLTNVTFSGNTAASGGGGFYDGDGSPILTNVTLSGNTAPAGGGIYENLGTLTVTNSILYGNTGGEIFNAGVAVNVTYSLVQGGFTGTGNLDANPLLGPLQNNGGFTQTMALGFKSPAIDKGIKTGCPPTDQRGLARPQGPACDMGAVEYPLSTLNLTSAGAQDGWILESAENSTLGGTMNAGATTFMLGDNAAKKQYRVILSFNTGGLPDNAVIKSAKLQLMKAGVVGANPFVTHGNILVDVRKPSFGTAVLQLTDFQVAPTKAGALTIKNSAVKWYSGVIPTANLTYLNKTGLTQFRLRFTKDDDNDLVADYLKIYSGNGGAANRPKLVITYYAP